VPVARAEFASQFLDDSGLRVPLSFDAAKLREVFSFGDPPYAVALENGRQIGEIRMFEGNEPRATLQRLGFIE